MRTHVNLQHAEVHKLIHGWLGVRSILSNVVPI